MVKHMVRYRRTMNWSDETAVLVRTWCGEDVFESDNIGKKKCQKCKRGYENHRANSIAATIGRLPDYK